MDTTQINEIAIQLSQQVVEKVSSEIEIKVAWIGIMGVVIGILGVGSIEWLKTWPKRRLDKQREGLLKKLLKDPNWEWRELETLSRVIGADEDETKRLLIKIEARGSTNKKGVWALISKKPLSAVDDDQK